MLHNINNGNVIATKFSINQIFVSNKLNIVQDQGLCVKNDCKGHYSLMLALQLSNLFQLCCKGNKLLTINTIISEWKIEKIEKVKFHKINPWTTERLITSTKNEDRLWIAPIKVEIIKIK